MVYEEQLKEGLWFPVDPSFVEVLRFPKLSVTQLYPNRWRILVAFQFIYFNNNMESNVALLFLPVGDLKKRRDLILQREEALEPFLLDPFFKTLEKNILHPLPSSVRSFG